MSWFSCDNSYCPYDIWAPGERTKVENVAFSSYAYHNQKMEDFINALAAVPDPNNYGVQNQIARSLGIRIDDFTDDEISYMENEIGRRHMYKYNG